MITVSFIREQLSRKLMSKDFVTDKSGVKTIEIVAASFVANEPLIFGAVNEEYVERELQWYKMQSLNVNDIHGGPPQIWKQVADKDGLINSNYGWCIYSAENGYQFWKVAEELERNPDSRRGIMIYTRPSMWKDYNKNGMSDFMCTNTVQYFIRDKKLHAVVNMRSNDVVFGYRNDWHWQNFVLEELLSILNNRTALKYTKGDIHWCVGSLHVYERHFYLVDHYTKTGSTHITKDEYDRLYLAPSVSAAG